MDSIFQLLDTLVADGSAWMYPMLFLGGVVASFMPCTYPVLPLTIGYVAGASGKERGRASLMSLALVLGMAVVYAVAGTLLAAVGLQLGAIWSSGWAVFAIALFFILMALFLMDVFHFPTPKFMNTLRAKTGNRNGIGGAFVVGAVSGLVVGPCTGPILFSVLAFIIAALQAADGLGYYLQIANAGLMLFLFGLGQGALIFLCGTFAGLLQRLPRAGQWMVTLRKGFALLILLGASLLLVYVGQDTDFPHLTSALGSLEKAEEPHDAAQTAATNERPATDPFGGDEFLD